MRKQINSAAERKPEGSSPAVKAALMLIGCSAVLGQIVLMRELMAVFNGNEISLGILLATWLFWIAMGSIVCSALAQHERHVRRMVAALECLLGISLPLTVWALRWSKSLFQTVPGELVVKPSRPRRKSPIASDHGFVPAENGLPPAAVNPPLPLPSNIVTLPPL